MIKLAFLLFVILFIYPLQVFSQIKIEGNFTITNIDSLTLEYYYIIEVSSEDTSELKIISEKINSKSTNSNLRIQIGKKYNFILHPKYEILDKRHGEDSVYLSPATMRNVSINNETFISSDYSTHPFTSKNLTGLFYTESNFKKNDSLNNFNKTLIDSLFDKGIHEVYFVKQIFFAGTSITGYKDDSIDKFCSSEHEYAIFWRQDQQTRYIVLDDCCYSDPFSQPDNMYLDLKFIFQAADTTYKNYEIKTEHCSPLKCNLYRFTKHNFSKKEFYCYGFAKANQKEALFTKLYGILNPIFYDEKVRSELCKNLIHENWQLQKN